MVSCNNYFLKDNNCDEAKLKVLENKIVSQINKEKDTITRQETDSTITILFVPKNVNQKGGGGEIIIDKNNFRVIYQKYYQ